MANLQKDLENYKQINNKLKADIEMQDEKLLNYANLEMYSKGGAKSTFNEIQRLKELIQKLTNDKNDMSKELENVMAENSLLRQMSKVPDNFGEKVSAYIKDQKDNALYYKRVNEYQEKQIQELEEEVTRLKAELRRYAGFFAKTDAMNEGLSDEQNRFLEDVVINLRQGRMDIPLTDKSKELQSKCEKMQAILENYDRILGDQKFNNTQFGKSNTGNPNLNDQQMQTILGAIRDQRKDLENMFMSMKPSHGNTQNTFIHHISQNPNMTESQNQNQSFYTSNNNNTINNINKPPKPIAGIFGDWTDANEGMSYKFNSKLQIKNYDEELAGMDIEKAKYFIATLQLHNMETMELLDQREKEFSVLNQELDEIKEKFQKALLVEDELFIKHHQEISKFNSKTEDLTKECENLKTTNMVLSHNVEVFEKSLGALQSKNPSTIEGRLAEMTKNAAISETNVIKLSRKYDALETEHNDLTRNFKVLDMDQNEREYQITEKMNGLLQWKADASEKLRILLGRLKNSVSVEEHNALKSAYDIEHHKYVSLKANEDAMIMKNADLKAYEREKAEESEKVKKLEDELAGIESEYGVLHMRLASLDPYYNRQSLVFKKIASVLKNNNLSPLQFFQSMDTNKDGTVSSTEFFRAMESMGIIMGNDESQSFFNFLDLDGSGLIDYTEFCRKLKRYGVVVRSKEEELVNKLWNAIVKGGFTLEQAYQAIDRNRDNQVTFNEMVTTFNDLRLDCDARTMSEFFKMADITEDGNISCAEFTHIFKRYNKISETPVTAETNLDWKNEMMVRLERLCQDKNVGLNDVFNDIDAEGDKDGRITVEEFRRMFLKMGIRIEKQAFLELFNSIDTNHNGVITYPEFLSYINVD